MINFNLHSFLLGRAALWNEMEGARIAAEKDRSGEVPSSLTASIERRTKFAMQECAIIIDVEGISGTCIRLERLFNNREFHRYTWAELHELLKRLWDGIEEQLGHEYFCHYRRDQGQELSLVDIDWSGAIGSFPSAEPEIRKGIDCLALDDYAGCVFHMCRVAEIGLRAIGRERGIRKVRKRISIDWATWGEVLDALEPRIDEIGNKSRGPQKDAALKFYSTVRSDLRAVQSFRDHSMHFHDSYDAGQANSAKFRVKELMITLASKLDENSTGAIPWSAWK